MVNKTKFYKTKVALAVVLSLGLAACGDSDGDEGSVSNSTTQSDATQNTVGNQDELTGTVQGVVVDTNGNPLEGVMVYLGDAETTTNAGGQYVFTDVGVTNVSGVNNEGNETADAYTQSLIVTIGGTAEYLGALVTVEPQAQVNNTGGTGDATVGGNAGSNSDTTIQTFVDGFTAEAGVAVLPMLNAGAYGYIRDCRTGAPLANTTDILSLDFTSVTNANDITDVISGSGNNGIQLTNAEDTHTIASDADGMFSLDMLAQNSTYSVSAKKGWKITSPSTAVTVSTLSEGSSEFLGTIEVCPVAFTAGPNTTPHVTNVAGVTEISAPDTAYGGTVDTSILDDNKVFTATGSTNQRYGRLTAGVNKEFIVTLSEALDTTTFQADDVEVIAYSATAGNSYVPKESVTLSADGTTLTVITTDALAAGTKFSILIPRFNSVDTTGLILDVFGDDYNGALDEAGNVRTAGGGDPRDELPLFAADGVTPDANDLLGGEIAGKVTYDYFFEGTSKATYVKLNLCIFDPVSTGGDGTAVQIIDDLSGSDAGSSVLANYSDAFQDARDNADAEVQQLNGQGAPTAALLEQLAVANGIAVTVDSDETRLDVTFAGASSATIAAASGSTFTATPASLTATGTVDLSGVERDEKAVVSFTDGFGVGVATTTVTLVDAIAPTTVVQDDYDLHDYSNASGYAVTTTATGELNYGNGGEVANDGVADQPGNPIVWIQPRHLAAKRAGNAQPLRGTEFVFLQDDKASRLDTANGDVEAAAPNTTLSTYNTNHVIYDALSWSVATAIPQEIAVAFSENIATNAATPVSGAGTLTGWVANNDVTKDVDGNDNKIGLNTGAGATIPADLVQFTTADVLGLANNNPLTALNVIDFTNAIQDTNATPNVAGANTEAKVVIADAMPPFVTAASWNGSTLVVDFNEAVKIQTGGTTISMENPETGTPIAAPIAVTSTNTVLSNSDKTMTITLTPTNQADVSAVFADGANNEFLYAEAAEGDATTEEQHAVLIWDNIQDATTTIVGTGAGNSWSEFANTDATLTDNDREEVFAPRFLAYNNVGPFVNTGYIFTGLGGGAGFVDTDGFTVEITFSHPVDLTADIDAGAGTPTITSLADGADAGTTFFDSIAEIRALFTIDIDGNNVYDDATEADTITLPAGTTAAIATSNSGTKITLSIPAAGAPSVIVGTSRVVMIDGALAAGNDGESLSVAGPIGHGAQLTSAIVPAGVKLPVAGSIQ